MSTVCYELSKESKAMLKAKFPPKYPDVRYDHVTIEMGGLGAHLPEPAQKVEVVGIADDGNGIEAFIVRVNGTPMRKDGRAWHITASFDSSKNAPAVFDIFSEPGEEKEKPYKPVTSNGFLAQVLDEKGKLKPIKNPNWKVQIFDKPIQVQTHPAVQYKAAELQKMQKMGISIV